MSRKGSAVMVAWLVTALHCFCRYALRSVPAVGLGVLLFAPGDSTPARVGRLLQGAGGVLALVGAVCIAATHLPASRVATCAENPR
jgi:hypothetical protein